MLFPGAAIFESARAAGAAVADALPDLALTHAVIDAPLLLPKIPVCVYYQHDPLFLAGRQDKMH